MSSAALLAVGPGASLGLPLPQAVSQEVEQFLAAAGAVDGDAAMRLRALPAHLQRLVVERGPIAGTRNPSSVLISRIRDAEMGRLVPGPLGMGLGNPEVERVISQYGLDAKASATLRSLPPDQLRAALAIPLHEARNPSAFLMTQLAAPRPGGGFGDFLRMSTQPRDPTAIMMSQMRF